jgi:hypothetical protein
MTVLESIRGFHKQYLDLSPVSGRDTHFVTLINSWHIPTATVKRRRWADWDLSPAN